MPKFTYQEIGREGLAFLHGMAMRQPGRYFRAESDMVNYPGTSVGEALQDLDANGLEVGGAHFTLYTYDPDSYPEGMLRAALEEYGDRREADLAAKRARRRKAT